MENIIPDIPTVGMEEDTMKDANTDIRYIGRRILGDVFFFKQNHSAQILDSRCIKLPCINGYVKCVHHGEADETPYMQDGIPTKQIIARIAIIVIFVGTILTLSD